MIETKGIPKKKVFELIEGSKVWWDSTTKNVNEKTVH